MEKIVYQKYLFLFLLFTISVPFNTFSVYGDDLEDLVYEDKVYNPNIKTVNLYVNKGYLGAQIEPAVVNIHEP